MPRYPWAEWLKGEPVEHTTDKPENFRKYLYTYCARNGLFVHATTGEGVVRFQVFDDQDKHAIAQQDQRKARTLHRSGGKFAHDFLTEQAPTHEPCSICGQVRSPRYLALDTAGNALYPYCYDNVTSTPRHQES